MGPRPLLGSEALAGGIISAPSQSGYYVITPFKLSDRDLTVLVNRGWIPKSKLKPETRMKGQINDEVEIVGIVRRQENVSIVCIYKIIVDLLSYFRDHLSE